MKRRYALLAEQVQPSRAGAAIGHCSMHWQRSAGPGWCCTAPNHAVMQSNFSCRHACL